MLLVVIRRHIASKEMKEILESNAFTKYLAGYSTTKEKVELEKWLKNHPNNAFMLATMKLKVEQMVTKAQVA